MKKIIISPDNKKAIEFFNKLNGLNKIAMEKARIRMMEKHPEFFAKENKGPSGRSGDIAPV